jgi:hypothetical protein
MSYTNAPATVLLATQCCACGRPLVDATSVELGIGPECRAGFDGGISDDVRQQANKLTHKAALAAQEGRIHEVQAIAGELVALGLAGLAEKVASRFTNAERLAKIHLTVVGDSLKVVTPYRRGDSEAFISAWRAVPGRRYRDKANFVPLTSEARRAVYDLLTRFFPGQYAKGPKGVFRLPKAEKAE